MSQKFTYAEVSKHASRGDLHVVIEGKVLDLTKFIHEHPGGEEVLVDQGGTDASEAFESVGHSPDARALLETLVIGTLDKRGGASTGPAKTVTKTPVQASSSGISLYVFILFGVLAAALGAYRIM